MKKYQIAIASNIFYTNRISFGSTEPEVVKWLLDEIKKIVPSCQVVSSRKDLLGNLTHCEVEKLSGKDHEIGMWIIQQLCEKGWEPFAIEGDGRLYHFRLEKID